MKAPVRPEAPGPISLTAQMQLVAGTPRENEESKAREPYAEVLERKRLEEMAVHLDAALHGLVTGQYRREKDLARLLSQARRRLQTPGSSPLYYQRLLALAHSINGADFDPLLPFLQTCDELWPYSESVGLHDTSELPAVKTTQELLMLAVSQGAMHDYFKPQREVERWIAQMSERIRQVLHSHVGLDCAEPAEIPALLYGTAVILHDLLGGLAPYFQRVPDKTRKELSFVAHVIGEIRRALFWTVTRDFLAEMTAAAGRQALLQGYLSFRIPAVKTYALPSRTDFQYVRLYLERMAGDQDILEEIHETTKSLHALEPLAASLRNCPLFSQKGLDDSGKEKVLPFGQVILAQGYGSRDEHTVFYIVDGVAHESRIAHSSLDGWIGSDIEVAPILQPKNGFVLGGVLSCFLDDDRKVFFSPIDRLAPSANDRAYPEAARTVGLVDAFYNRAVLEEWENYPDLFARLDSIGPLVFAQLPMGKYLLCRAECLPEIKTLRGWEAQKDNETLLLLNRLRMNAGENSWAGIVLERRGTLELPAKDPRKRWRAMIRKRMERHRIPDFRSLMARLAPFGVEATTEGKGSHGTLRLQGRIERKQTTWYALRKKADPLPITFVWECLERLGIDYKDFYQSLSDD